MSSPPPVVVYVASLSHSGSTLLDLLLSSHPRAQGLGEVKKLSSRPRQQPRKVHLDEQACDCGVRPRRRCEFWAAIDSALAREGLGLDALELEDGPDERFHAHNRAFYRAACAAAGGRVLVDSSKSLDRLARLLGTPGLDVRPIHLVRDPRGVACSHARRGHSWPYTVRRWLRFEREAARRLAGHDPLHVHYEALAADPGAVVAEAMAWLGLPFDPAQLRWAEHTHHHLAGNRLRTEPPREIRPDDAWRRELGPVERALIPLLARLGSLGRGGSGRA